MLSLGNRMKKYESVYDQQIIGRVPIIIRTDGKNFHNYTKSIKSNKPFDKALSCAMSYAMCSTAEKIEGCLFGYTQSDEATFVLRNDQSLESTPWFDNRTQKMCSIVSSMFTAYFASYMSGLPVAFFDTRVFAVPTVQEATNCLIFRQQDAVKNSISCACHYEVGKVVGQKTAQKLMHGLNGNQQQELLFQKAGINWNDYPTKFKRGSGCSRQTYYPVINGIECERAAWKIDNELPIFTKEPEYLKNILGQDE